jgi:ParB-like chromosome segregation protein Spo0J
MKTIDDIKEALKTLSEAAPNKADFLNDFKIWMHDQVSDHKEMPVDTVIWVPIEMVQANDYNPNSVASNELKLLHTSISHDGYTQPIVTIYEEDLDKYIIIDGFHRYFTCRANLDIQEKTGGRVPIVVLKKTLNDRMASTVRHNRARGKHSVNGMANLVFNMLDNGWEDADICNELGMEADELFRLKYMTGFAKLFEDVEYHKAWETRRQLTLKKEWKKEHPNGD